MYSGDDVTSPIERPIQTVYEVRETPPSDNPAGRGRLVNVYQTYRAAFRAAQALDASGRNVYVVRSDNY